MLLNHSGDLDQQLLGVNHPEAANTQTQAAFDHQNKFVTAFLTRARAGVKPEALDQQAHSVRAVVFAREPDQARVHVKRQSRCLLVHRGPCRSWSR